jgi:hyaluronan synthase
VRHEYDIPRVRWRRPPNKVFVLSVVVLVLLLALARHVWYLEYWRNYRLLTVLWTVTFIAIGIQWLLSWLERPYTVTRNQQDQLNELTVTIAVPVYNEDPEIVDRTLYSIFSQTRPPNRVHVVDDGSQVDYSAVRDWWAAHHSPLVEFTWVWQPNAGKKRAHARAFRGDDADIFITVDSDTALERDAIFEGLKPFTDRRVQSVAGIELAANHDQSLLVRLKSVNTLVWQFITCSAQNVAGGNVLVNRGTFALYRGELIRDTLDAYVGETFLGHPVMLGDDSMLTTFALGRGRAVQQPTAACFSMYPETFSHTMRQWIRWMRGSSVRNVWRIRYLSLRSWGWWFTVLPTWWFFAFVALLFAVIADWRQAHGFAISVLYVGAVWGWIIAVRMFTIRRSDQRWLDRLEAFFLVPFAMAWMTVVLRPIRLYGIVTVFKQGWVTRGSKIEVVSSS